MVCHFHCINWHLLLSPFAHQNYVGAFEPHGFLSISLRATNLFVLGWGCGRVGIIISEAPQVILMGSQDKEPMT